MPPRAEGVAASATVVARLRSSPAMGTKGLSDTCLKFGGHLLFCSPQCREFDDIQTRGASASVIVHETAANPTANPTLAANDLAWGGAETKERKVRIKDRPSIHTEVSERRRRCETK